MSMEEAIERLKTYEEWIKPKVPAKNQSPQLLLHKTNVQDPQRNPNRSQYRGDTQGRYRGRGRNNARGRSAVKPTFENKKVEKNEQTKEQPRRDRRNLRCYNCDKYGHFSAECRAPRKETDEANLTIEEDEPTLLIAMCSAEKVLLIEESQQSPGMAEEEANSCSTWYLDNGASNHMTGHLEYFTDLVQQPMGHVKFGDGSMVEIKGKGEVTINCKNGDWRVLSNIYYIPDLCNNIISLGQLSDSGCEVSIQGGVLRVYEKNGALLMKAQHSKNRLFQIRLDVSIPTSLLAKVDDPAWLWHARVGHINFATMSEMTKKALVVGVPRICHPAQVCDACLAGKHKRSPFPTQTTFRSRSPLELVYMDICGPISPPTPAGNLYFLLIVDDYSRYIWSYMLKTKGQPLGYFKKFKVHVEKNQATELRP